MYFKMRVQMLSMHLGLKCETMHFLHLWWTNLLCSCVESSTIIKQFVMQREVNVEECQRHLAEI